MNNHDHKHAHDFGDDHELFHSSIHDHSHFHEHHHDGEHSHEHTSAHSHGHEHGHTHSEDEIKAVTNRIARAIGHLNHVKQMVSDGKDCSEVLIQLSAVKSALNNVGLLILQSHIEHCIVEAVQSGDHEAINNLNAAIARYLK